jgi:hypothetical protein
MTKDYIIPPIPPIPPSPIGAPAGSGLSATMASVVREECRNGRRVLQRRARHLGGVDDAGLHEVDQFPGRGVEPDRTLGVGHFAHLDGTLVTGVRAM